MSVSCDTCDLRRDCLDYLEIFIDSDSDDDFAAAITYAASVCPNYTTTP